MLLPLEDRRGIRSPLASGGLPAIFGVPWLVDASLQPLPSSSVFSLPSVSLSRFPLFRGTQWYWMRAYPNDLILAYHSCTDAFLIRSHCEVLGARTSPSFWRHMIQPLTVTYNDGEERACGDTRGIASHWPTRLGSPRKEMTEERKQDPHLEGP